MNNYFPFMKLLIFSIALILYDNTALAANFVDSLAKEFGKKNGCYSISLNDKKNKSYNLSPEEKNSSKSKR
tara:strand:- start:171 stop:383 length:213 start_codon:yes stop_codon:yes gene_type:complete